jgi:hypothetical protein
MVWTGIQFQVMAIGLRIMIDVVSGMGLRHNGKEKENSEHQVIIMRVYPRAYNVGHAHNQRDRSTYTTGHAHNQRTRRTHTHGCNTYPPRGTTHPRRKVDTLPFEVTRASVTFGGCDGAA